MKTIICGMLTGAAIAIVGAAIGVILAAIDVPRNAPWWDVLTAFGTLGTVMMTALLALMAWRFERVRTRRRAVLTASLVVTRVLLARRHADRLTKLFATYALDTTQVDTLRAMQLVSDRMSLSLTLSAEEIEKIDGVDGIGQELVDAMSSRDAWMDYLYAAIHDREMNAADSNANLRNMRSHLAVIVDSLTKVRASIRNFKRENSR